MKKTLTILVACIISNFTFAQTTIPDTNFEQALINLGLDVGTPDGTVPSANIDTLTSLNINAQSISDLTGIEDFTALTTLLCGGNNLTNLDVTNNTALTLLDCSQNNALTSLDVTNNTALIYLICFNIPLTSLDVTNNTALTQLTCWDTQLASLDVTNNTALTRLECGTTLLTSLDITNNTALTQLDVFNGLLTSLNVANNTALTSLNCANSLLNCLNVKNGNNSNFTFFVANNNPNLNCIEVDNTAYSTSNWTLGTWAFNVDPSVSFSTNCSNACTSVGINEYSSFNFNIYPNPTSNQLTIDTELTINEVSIADLTGKTITTTNQHKKIVDVANLSNGIYFIQVVTENRTITRKFVKQ